MIETLIWASALAFMFLGGGIATVLCVHTVEAGKNQRLHEIETTKRQGMQNAFMIETEKLESHKALPPGSTPGVTEYSAITFDLKGADGTWK